MPGRSHCSYECHVQSKLSGFSSELEAAGQRTEVKCTGIRKEVSKALQDQRQQLIAQAESMARRMDAVTLKVQLPWDRTSLVYPRPPISRASWHGCNASQRRLFFFLFFYLSSTVTSPCAPMIGERTRRGLCCIPKGLLP